MTPFDGPVLHDPSLDRRLEEDGIVAVPLLGPEDVAHLRETYWRLVPPGEGGMRLDYLREDRELVARTNATLAKVLERRLPDVLVQHVPVYSSFVAKHPGPDSSLFLHRDLAVDDERHHRTFALWMPLVDTGAADNGPVSFVLGSQHLRAGQCGPNTVTEYAAYSDHLRSRLTAFSVPAGTALVYDGRMLHASGPNNTDTPRLALGCLLAHRDRPPVQVVASGRRHRRVHVVDAKYFVDHRPEDIDLGGMPDRYPVVDEYDEEPVLAAREFLGAELGAGHVPRSVIVPSDLVDRVGPAGPLHVEAGHWRVTHGADVPLAAADLGAVAGPNAVDAELSTVGAVGRFALWRGRVTSVLPGLPEVSALLGEGVTAADVVVLDAHARLTVGVPALGDAVVDVVVVECVPVRSGAAVAGAAAELDLGMRIVVAPGEPLHLWNDGPGPLVVLLRRNARWRPGWRDLPWRAKDVARRRLGIRADG